MRRGSQRKPACHDARAQAHPASCLCLRLRWGVRVASRIPDNKSRDHPVKKGMMYLCMHGVQAEGNGLLCEIPRGIFYQQARMCGVGGSAGAHAPAARDDDCRKAVVMHHG